MLKSVTAVTSARELFKSGYFLFENGAVQRTVLKSVTAVTLCVSRGKTVGCDCGHKSYSPFINNLH